MPPTQVTPEFRSEIRNVVHTDRFDVVSYTFRDGGVEATVTTFLKLGDIPVPEVAKIVESVPAPQREKVWRDMVPSMSEENLLEGVVFGVVPIEVLSVPVQMKLPVHVLYENGSKVSVEVLIGALKGVEQKRVAELIKTLPSAKQKQVWDGYVATLTPEEVSAGVKAGLIPAEYGPPSRLTPPRTYPNFGKWRFGGSYEVSNSGYGEHTQMMYWQVPYYTASFWVDLDEPRKSGSNLIDGWGDSPCDVYFSPPVDAWSGDAQKDEATLFEFIKASLTKMYLCVAEDQEVLLKNLRRHKAEGRGPMPKWG